MKKLMLVLSLWSGLLLAADNNGIGVINFKKVVEDSKIGKKEKENYEALKNQMEKTLDEKEKALEAISKKLNDPDFMDSLSNEKEAELKHEYRTLSEEMSQMQSHYYQALNQANYKVLQKIGELVSNAAKELAAEKKLKLVLNEELSFYHDPALDLTGDVLKKLDNLPTEKK
jgi:outer membrane protein